VCKEETAPSLTHSFRLGKDKNISLIDCLKILSTNNEGLYKCSNVCERISVFSLLNKYDISLFLFRFL
jgi:hypothetical protein